MVPGADETCHSKERRASALLGLEAGGPVDKTKTMFAARCDPGSDSRCAASLKVLHDHATSVWLTERGTFVSGAVS